MPAMRRPPHEGRNPRPLHENATRRSQPRIAETPSWCPPRAVHTQEPVREDAAVEIGADLALDESGHRCARLPCAGEEGLELFADHLVEERLLGPVAFVPGHAVP